MEKIRISLFAEKRPKLVYKYKLYAFQTENEAVEPLKLLEICEVDDHNEYEKPNDSDEKQLEFNQEWIHQKVLFQIEICTSVLH